MLKEVLDRIERKERKMFARVQRKLLELYTEAHKQARKVQQATEISADKLIDSSLAVLDDEDFDSESDATEAKEDGPVYRNDAHRCGAWLSRISNRYPNVRDCIIWLILVFIGVAFYWSHYSDKQEGVTFVSSLYWVIITGYKSRRRRCRYSNRDRWR